MCSVHNAIEFEKRGIPATVIITSAFRSSLELQFKGMGMPGHPCIEVPHPVHYHNREKMRAIAKQYVDEAVKQLSSGK